MTISLTFETDQGSFDKEFDINSTISEVKQEIADELGTSISAFTIEYEGDALDDDTNLEELDIPDFATIQVILKEFSVQVDISGKRTKFDLKASDLIQELYKQVAERSNVQQSQVELYSGGKLLSPSKTFIQAEISSSTVLQAVIKPIDTQGNTQGKSQGDTQETTKDTPIGSDTRPKKSEEKKDQALIKVIYPNGDTESIFLKFSDLICEFVGRLDSKVHPPPNKYPRFVLNSYTVTRRDDRTFDKFLTDTQSPRLSNYTASVFWDYSDGALQ